MLKQEHYFRFQLVEVNVQFAKSLKQNMQSDPKVYHRRDRLPAP